MSAVRPCELPTRSFLFIAREPGSFADCYVAEIDDAVSQTAFVEAFYTTRLFKAERLLLALFVGKPSTDAQARDLAAGAATSFAAWRVENRSPEQLLLADFTGRTRSWLMTEPVEATPGSPRTRLYFGSGVEPRTRTTDGRSAMGFGFRALLGFHTLYSRLLLKAARSRLLANGRTGDAS